MKQRYEIRFSGYGGQGIITAAIILAEACIIEGKNAVQTQSYGPESRGGVSKADVVISNEEIDYPKAISLDVLVAFNQESYYAYKSAVKENGAIIADSHYVEISKDEDKGKTQVMYSLFPIPLSIIARDKVGKEITTNIVALGALVEKTGIVSKESIEKAVLARVPKGTEEMNKKALQLGFEAMQEALSSLTK